MTAFGRWIVSISYEGEINDIIHLYSLKKQGRCIHIMYDMRKRQYKLLQRSVNKKLLSDTKLTKDIIQLIIVGDLSRDLTQVLQTAPDVQCQQVTRCLRL